MGQKRYTHDYVDGELVYDLEFKEVFVFTDKADGYRAQVSGKQLRRATPEEYAEHQQRVSAAASTDRS